MSNEAPTDALRLVPISALPDEIDLFRILRAAGRSNREKAFAVSNHLQALAAAPASPPAYVRTPNEDDRLRRALYRLLERHGAGPDPLSVIGSLWDTLDQGECTDLIEDWLITGKVIQVEGDIDEMLASIPKEAPASPLPGGGWQDISTLRESGQGNPVIVAVPTKEGGWIVGEAWKSLMDADDPYRGNDGWWWAGTSPGDAYNDPIRFMNHGDAEWWMPLPAAPTGDA